MIIGLSGGIAAGKNFVAQILEKKGAVIFDADFEVHQIYTSDEEVILLVEQYFPEAVIDKKIDRQILSQIIIHNHQKIKILENIIHPKIRDRYNKFIKDHKDKIIILNIPLLLENSGYNYDYLFAIITDLQIRKQRFIAREKLKENNDIRILERKFDKIVALQIDDKIRISKADLVINGADLADNIAKQIDKFLSDKK